MAELADIHRSVSVSVRWGQQCSLTSSLHSEGASGKTGKQMVGIASARLYSAVSIQSPRELPSWCAWARLKSGGLSSSQEFSQCVGLARACVTFNMVEAGPIPHPLAEGATGQKEINGKLMVLSQLDCEPSLWSLEVWHPSRLATPVYSCGLIQHTCRRKSQEGGFQLLLTWETLSGYQ